MPRGKRGLSENYSTANSTLDISREFYFLANRTVNNFIDEIDSAVKVLQNEISTGVLTNGIVRGQLINIKIPDEIVIVGDLHGDLETLVHILQEISFRKFCANPNNKLIFLGDYIDRGSDSAGVIQVVCYLKRAYQDSVLLLCGNHEAVEKFHFPAHTLPQELRERYGSKGNIIYDKILCLFKLLPKVIVVDGQLIITHGGLPAITNRLSFFDSVINGDERVTEEILWNDPRSDIPNNQDWCQSRRSFGKHFGRNITKKHLEHTHTKILIRGHEPCHGFRIDHDGMVLTLFSSKEAYQKFDAAYLHITKDQLHSAKNADGIIQYIKKMKG